MKQQSHTGSDGDELDFMKYRKYCDAIFDKTIETNNNNRYSAATYRDSEPNKIDEMQMTLKTYPSGWSEVNSARITSELAESPVYPNLFDVKNGLPSKLMSPIATTNIGAAAAATDTASPAFTSHDSLTHREYYYSNTKPKFSGTSTPPKKPRLHDSRYQLGDFHASTDSESAANQTDKLTHQSDKSGTVYENAHTGGGEYQSNRSVQQTSFGQSSAFHPPLFADNSSKKSNSSFGSMSHMSSSSSSYQYVDPGGGGGGGGGYPTTYTTLDMNNSSSSVSSNNSPTEREQRTFGKVFAKDDDMNAHDYKEYTTLQPAGIGSKAASVIQDVARDGGATTGSTVVMNSNSNTMNNSNVQSAMTTPTTTPKSAATNERSFLLERPMAAYSPTNTTHKGKTIVLYKSKCLLHV